MCPFAWSVEGGWPSRACWAHQDQGFDWNNFSKRILPPILKGHFWWLANSPYWIPERCHCQLEFNCQALGEHPSDDFPDPLFWYLPVLRKGGGVWGTSLALLWQILVIFCCFRVHFNVQFIWAVSISLPAASSSVCPILYPCSSLARLDATRPALPVAYVLPWTADGTGVSSQSQGDLSRFVSLYCKPTKTNSSYETF